MKIAWHMPTLRRSCCGLSIRALRLADGLRQMGHDVTFLVAENKTDIVSNSISGHRLQRLSTRRTVAMHWSLQALTRRRIGATLAEQFDVDHDIMLSCQPEFVAAYGKHHLHHPIVFICGGTTLLHDEADSRQASAQPRPKRWLYAIDRLLKHRNEKAAFRTDEAVIFDSHATRELAIRDYRLDPDCCHTIHSGVDPEAFVPPSSEQRIEARRGLEISDHDRVLVWTGRLSSEKNLDLLLHALARCRQGPDHVFIVGDGPDRGGLTALAERLGLIPRVRFTGESSDVLGFLHAADAFVFPSRGESFGTSLIEAMATGLASIALRPDGASIRNASLEILEHEKTGLLIDRADPAALASGIDRLMSDREFRDSLGTAARRRAELSFTWPQAISQLNDLLIRLGGAARRSRSSTLHRADATARSSYA